jgi:hypothetical protein
MIINQSFASGNFDECIRTEELIFSQLQKRAGDISDEFELFPYSLAVPINRFGLEFTNNFIGKCESEKRRVFVCQHIWVSHLKFLDSDLVFTPHTTKDSIFYAIPHQSVNWDIALRSTEKTIDFSFVGNLGAHPVRKQMSLIFPDRVKDSGIGWGLDKTTPAKSKRDYIDLISKSFFSLCPRGTGISSVRLFEVMGMGSIPIIIADGYSPPLSHLLDWSQFSLIIPEKSIGEIESIVKDLLKDKNRMENMRQKAIEIYDLYFANDLLYKTIEITLNESF